MLGVPSRSDIGNSSYKEALEDAAKLRKVSTISGLALDRDLIGHASLALRLEGESTHLVSKIKERGYGFPRDAARHLNPNAVLTRYSTKTDDIIRAAMSARHVLDANYEVISSDEHYSGNILKDTSRLLTNFTTELRKACNSSSDPAKSLHQMWNVLNVFQNRLFYFSAIIPSGYGTLHNFEDTRKVRKMKEENERICRTSDFALRFDEEYITYDGSGGIPTQGIFTEMGKYMMDRHGLHNRLALRQLIENKLKKKSCVTINGVQYTFDGEMFFAHKESFVSIANVLGAPVFFQKRIAPEQWAIDEVKLIKDIRNGEASPIELLNKYSGFLDPLTMTMEESAESVHAFLKHSKLFA